MVEISKPDYLSMVNKNGSGFNISEIVDAMVTSEVEPNRILQNAKLEKAETTISGIALLKSQLSQSQANFDIISDDSFFDVAKNNTSHFELTALDETKIQSSNHNISNINVAKNMVFEFPGFSITDTFTETLSIDLGKWTQSSFDSETVIVSPAELEAGKTYVAVASRGDGSAFDEFTRDPHDPSSDAQYMYPTDSASSPNLGVDAYFRTSSNFSNPNWDFKEVDNYTFSKKTGTTTVSINSDGDTLSLTQFVALIDAVDGISAELIKKSESGTEYSVVVSSDDTGIDNGFKISSNQAGDTGQRWSTSLFNETETAYGNTLTQGAEDATFQLNGVEVTRSNNVIDDLIAGVEIKLLDDFEDGTQIGISRSEEAIRQTINDTILSLNELKSQLDTLTFIDVEGGENGPLAMEPSATLLKSKLKSIMIEPIQGYGESAVYLSQLGIKTDRNGIYQFDEATFSKTLGNTPEKFHALKDANLNSSVSTVEVTKSQFTSIDPGSYTVSNDTGSWKFGDQDLTRVDSDNGGSKFTTSAYPGLVIETIERNPSNFNIYVGKSFSDKFLTLVESILDFESSLNKTEDNYADLKVDIQDRLDQLDERAKLLSDRYTKQFGQMETAMNEFNSTKSLLENLVESWNSN